MAWPIVLAIFGGIVLYLICFSLRKRRNLPPGPRGLPIVGYAPFLGKFPFIEIMQLSKKYGSVFTLPLGNENVLVLNDWASVKEALLDNAEVFSGRPDSSVYRTLYDHSDIVFANGAGWKERRRFTLQHLRDLGFGKKSLEDVVMVEVEKIIERLKQSPKADICGFFYISFMNIIWTLVGGKSFRPNDQYMGAFIDVTQTVFKEISSTNPINFMPWLRFLPGASLRKTLDANDRFYKFFDDEITEHIKTYQKDHKRDFIDMYLEEIFRHDELKLKTKAFTRKILRGVMHNLFNAGVDTGSNTLSWALLYMTTWPQIQKKVQDELDEVIGPARMPLYSDRPYLPYTEAVIMEIHRYASIVPLSVLHCTTANTKFRNYDIPKNTYVLQNIWGVHRDPNMWDDPEVFRPERFLSESGQAKKPEYLIPFSVGSRFCLGEPLARMEVFLFFTSLLHKFQFSNVPGIPPRFDPVVAITLGPQPFSVVAKPR